MLFGETDGKKSTPVYYHLLMLKIYVLVSYNYFLQFIRSIFSDRFVNWLGKNISFVVVPNECLGVTSCRFFSLCWPQSIYSAVLRCHTNSHGSAEG